METEPLRANDEEAIDYYWVGSFARHAGTVVHRWLQKMANGEIEKDVTTLASLQPTTERWLTSLGVRSDDLPSAGQRVQSALQKILEDSKGRWLLDGTGHAEFALSGVIEGRVESVILDRVRVDEEGVHWVVDYKTSTHEGGDLKQFLQQEQDRYRSQLVKYGNLYRSFSGAEVRTALYFPLLGEFLEVAELPAPQD